MNMYLLLLFCCNSYALHFEDEEHGRTKAKGEANTAGKASNDFVFSYCLLNQ